MVKVNTPIPHSLRSEARKAAKILGEFTMPSAKTGLDSVIPAGLIFKAQGLAVLTVAKFGFLVTARGGSGIVIAKLPDGSWSAPSAIGIAGLGGGFEIGCEVTDFVIILNTEASVGAFSKGGNLTLGGNFTIAAGPLGRNVEGDIAVRSAAAIYTYSKTKGLFAGISIEGSALIERKDANRKFYCDPDIRAYDILGGKVECPKACDDLYLVLGQHREMFLRAQEAQEKAKEAKAAREAALREQYMDDSAGGAAAYSSTTKTSKSAKRTQSARRGSTGSPGYHGDDPYGSGNYDNMNSDDDDNDNQPSSRSYKTKTTKTRTTSTTVVRRTQSMHTAGKPLSMSEFKAPPTEKDAWEKPPMARALWPFSGQMTCDLSFQPGDEIEVLTRTETQEDWWEGKLNGHVGIFPANFVEVLS